MHGLLADAGEEAFRVVAPLEQHAIEHELYAFLERLEHDGDDQGHEYGCDELVRRFIGSDEPLDEPECRDVDPHDDDGQRGIQRRSRDDQPDVEEAIAHHRIGEDAHHQHGKRRAVGLEHVEINERSEDVGHGA